MPQRKRRIPKICQTASDNIRYEYIDKMYEQLQRGGCNSSMLVEDVSEYWEVYEGDVAD